VKPKSLLRGIKAIPLLPAVGLIILSLPVLILTRIIPAGRPITAHLHRNVTLLPHSVRLPDRAPIVEEDHPPHREVVVAEEDNQIEITS